MKHCFKQKQKYITFILAFYTYFQQKTITRIINEHIINQNKKKTKTKKEEKQGKCEIKVYILLQEIINRIINIS